MCNKLSGILDAYKTKFEGGEEQESYQQVCQSGAGKTPSDGGGLNVQNIGRRGGGPHTWKNYDKSLPPNKAIQPERSANFS